MYQQFIRKNITLSAILLFLVLFYIVHSIKPHLAYNEDGSIKPFGLGNTKKTILPIWLIAICIAMLAYLFILYYLAAPKLIH